VNVYYCQSDDSSLPLAITRYTSYDQEEKVLCVEQVVYEEDINYFQEQITAALNVALMSQFFLLIQPLNFQSLQH